LASKPPIIALGRALAAASLLIVLSVMAQAPLNAQSTRQTLSREPACQALTPVSAGGLAPKADDVVVVRWLGTTNYELVYRGNAYLLDAYYDRLPKTHAIGVAAGDITRVRAIFVGHAHYDHVADAAAIARQTGATVVGAASARDVVVSMGLPAKQVSTVRGGEVLEYPGVTVQPVRGAHDVIASTAPAGHLEKQQAALQAASLVPPLTDAERQQADRIRARGNNDPAAAADGVITYLFTFGRDFRIAFVDSPGPVTDAQRQIMQGVPSIDVALLPYEHFEAGVAPLVELATLLKPSTVFLGHHDGPGVAQWAANYPAALALRDALPRVRTMDVLYRTPVCFSTTSKEMFTAW
jgi:L-ascorbate metabolism protein UlaG (beta-lactamase superfamily)